MVRIWGRANSINVQKVLWACHELGLAFERRDAGMQFGLTDTPAFLAMNPNGLVPVLQDGDLVLWESHAIVRYLARREGQGKLWPADHAEAAHADQWMDWAATTVWPDMRVVFINLVRRTAPQRDMQAVATAMEGLKRNLAILDQHLSTAPWVAGGDALTVADIPLGVIVHRWFALDLERPAFEHLRQWYDRVCERPGFQHYCAAPLS